WRLAGIFDIAAIGFGAPSLIGRFDRVRTAALSQKILAAIAERRTATIIFDITGVEGVDQRTVAELLDLARAVRLLAVGATSGASAARPRQPPPSDRAPLADGRRLGRGGAAWVEQAYATRREGWKWRP